MALSGLDVYKLLPKTNCKKCGFQTCLAFAMQLAKKAVAVDKCPFVTEQARVVLEEAGQPAIRLVAIGAGERPALIGNETVLFRHEEKFHHPTALGFILDDTLSAGALAQALKEIEALDFERVGQRLQVDLVALRETSGDPARFLAALGTLRQRTTLPLALMARTPETLKKALETAAGDRPLVYCGHIQDFDDFLKLAQAYCVPLAFRAPGIAEFSSAARKALAAGFADLVLDIDDIPAAERLWQLTQLRRLAVRKGARGVGFPVMAIVRARDPLPAAVEASLYIAKYAGLVLLETRQPQYILPLLTLRQNIFTDPQKPLQVEPRVYAVGAAGDRSPVLVTTNFSLTYYTVLGELEASRVPSHLICVDTEGMSVLTAWAAEKFTPEHIADTLVKFRLEEIVKHRRLIIPGYVSMMSGDLQEKSGWEILVGPREAASLPSYLKNLKE